MELTAFYRLKGIIHLMHTSEDSIKLHVNQFICLGMTHFPPCAAITRPTCQSSTCSTLAVVWLSFNHVLHSSARKNEKLAPFDSFGCSHQVCQIAFLWSDYSRICITRQNLQRETKTSGCFHPLSSFVMRGTKAERGFKDEVLDTSALLIG